MRALHSILLAMATSIALVAPTMALDEDQSRSYVKQFGATGDGLHDDTFAFQQAIAQVKAGGIVIIPEGNFTLSSTLVITKPVTILGAGFASQLYNNNGQTLIQLLNVQNVVIRDLYLGSSSTGAGVSLIELINSHRNQINNVTMEGGYYGLHLVGSLLNTIIDMRSGVNIGGFFGSVSPTNTWVKGEPLNKISANANTFIAPVLEGGTNGIVLTDNAGQGSINILGGTMEGISGTALMLNGTNLPSSVTGTHFEANGVDVSIQASTNIRLSAIVSLSQINLLGDTRNVSITDSVANNIFLDVGDRVYPGGALTLGSGTGVKRIILQNITTCVAQPSAIVPPPVGDPYFGGLPNGPSSPLIANPAKGNQPRQDIVYLNIGNYCGGG